jgi:hypothetical protein
LSSALPAKRIGRFSGPVRFVLTRRKKIGFPKWNLFAGHGFISPYRRTEVMLVERGLQVLNVEVVGDAYAIASNYLRKSGAIADTLSTNERLLELIVQIFQRGEMNRLRLANKAITRFEARELV